MLFFAFFGVLNKAQNEAPNEESCGALNPACDDAARGCGRPRNSEYALSWQLGRTTNSEGKNEAVVKACNQDIVYNLARPGFRKRPCRLP
jgi:hypothetical protein